MNRDVIVIGAGIGGLTTSILLAKSGFQVRVIDQATCAGGKLKQMHLGPYRFDRGPSLLTLPEHISELGALAGLKPFDCLRLSSVVYTQFEDGTSFSSGADVNSLALVLDEAGLASSKTVLNTFKLAARHYRITAPVFLKQSLHRWRSYFKMSTLKGIMLFPIAAVFKSMANQNASRFKNPKVQQFFNRYATYNGSNPYRAPGLLNMIPHLEFECGAYFPKQGMAAIPEYLYEAACKLGVKFIFNTRVTSVLDLNLKTKVVHTASGILKASILVCNTDVHFFYTQLAPQLKYAQRFKKAEKSSSAYVFFWGINRSFDQLQVHNIFFSKNYKQEFSTIFDAGNIPEDPTIYVHISAKVCSTDAPKGHENWFVMVNVPHNSTQLPISYGPILRQHVINKLNRMLHTLLQNHIVEESTQDPFTIERDTSSFGGSLYGNSSNSKWSAFLRHPNFKSTVKGLYFTGGSVHPGGGIPLCIFSGHITAGLIKKDYTI
ncbi:MAG: phytoene desaturase family protein [Bacteroidia bacterium]